MSSGFKHCSADPGLHLNLNTVHPDKLAFNKAI